MSEVKTIKVDLDKKNGPVPVVNVDKIIPLEMTEESLLSDIYDLKVRSFKDRFYILDAYGGRCLYAFSDKGSFLHKTLTGRGPGELINPVAFAIDRNNRVLKLYDQRLPAMLTLDTDLNILSSKKWDTIFVSNLQFLDDDRVLIYHNKRTGYVIESSHNSEFYQYTLYEDNFSKATRLKLTTFYNGPPLFIPTPFSVSDEILLIVPSDYTVYRMKEDGQVEPAYEYDFGKYMYTDNEVKRLSNNEKETLQSNGEKISSLGLIQKNKDFLMCIIALQKKPITLAHSLESGITYNLNDCVDKHLLPACYAQCAIGESSFLALADPMAMKTFVEESDSKKYADLDVSENDNPYLIVYSIKEKEEDNRN